VKACGLHGMQQGYIPGSGLSLIDNLFTVKNIILATPFLAISFSDYLTLLHHAKTK
jgi:hypothetical protein